MSVESQQTQPLLWNGSENTPVARQRFSIPYVFTTTEAQATIKSGWKLFSLQSVPKLHNEEQSVVI
jgi:hypothetical protein